MADADAFPAAMLVLTLLPMFMLVPVPTIVAGGIRSEASWSVGPGLLRFHGGNLVTGDAVTNNSSVIGL